jgi:hypothetical protein
VTNEHDLPASILFVSSPVTPSAAEQHEEAHNAPQLGIYVQTLAKLGHLGRASGAEFAFGQASLMQGGRLTVDPLTNAMVVCTASGALRCVTYESRNSHDGMVRTSPFQDDNTAGIPMVLLARDAGATVLLNAGTEPASVWILTVTAQ